MLVTYSSILLPKHFAALNAQFLLPFKYIKLGRSSLAFLSYMKSHFHNIISFYFQVCRILNVFISCNGKHKRWYHYKARCLTRSKDSLRIKVVRCTPSYAATNLNCSSTPPPILQSTSSSPCMTETFPGRTFSYPLSTFPHFEMTKTPLQVPAASVSYILVVSPCQVI